MTSSPAYVYGQSDARHVSILIEGPCNDKHHPRLGALNKICRAGHCAAGSDSIYMVLNGTLVLSIRSAVLLFEQPPSPTLCPTASLESPPLQVKDHEIFQFLHEVIARTPRCSLLKLFTCVGLGYGLSYTCYWLELILIKGASSLERSLLLEAQLPLTVPSCIRRIIERRARRWAVLACQIMMQFSSSSPESLQFGLYK